MRGDVIDGTLFRGRKEELKANEKERKKERERERERESHAAGNNTGYTLLLVVVMSA